jgi:tetratricopeptide (TPR) repeat protein
MPKIDLETERKKLDKDITLFHFKKARNKIKKCLKEARKTKDRFFFFYFLAQHCIVKENFYKAIYYLNNALNIKENDGCAHNDKAICLAELKQYKKALECFDKGLHKAPDCAILYHNKGWLLNCLGKYKEAQLCFNTALELEKDRVESLFSIADTYSHLGNKLLAKKYFKNALERIKGNSSYLYKETLKRLRSLEE